ncbi:hypothetical protein V8G54_030878 [Vigna mungo]|uniref:Uncharacterized protein n=1 Tax=Vigna mungo TaxID=3915 RepID=A0AAQ3RMT4_VIGMU
MNKMSYEAKKKRTINVVPNLTRLVVATHQPQSVLKNNVPTKRRGTDNVRKILKGEFSLQPDSSKSKAIDYRGLDSPQNYVCKGVQVTVTDEEKKVIEEAEPATIICIFLKFHCCTLAYRDIIYSLLKKKITNEDKAKKANGLTNLKKKHEDD